MAEFTHIDADGSAIMVDVTAKDVTKREATAAGDITMSTECFEAIVTDSVAKGDVLGTARIGGIMALKRTAELIPLCHTLRLTHASIEFRLDEVQTRIEARCTVRCTGKTGVEMEALTGVSVALLTIYDMCKAIDRSMCIGNIRLLAKSGGASGAYTAPQEDA